MGGVRLGLGCCTIALTEHIALNPKPYPKWDTTLLLDLPCSVNLSAHPTEAEEETCLQGSYRV